MFGRDGVSALSPALAGKFDRDQLLWDRVQGTLYGSLVAGSDSFL